ncbi:MAG: response regulator [Thermoplasmata archaeon]|nr:response regulator [Thermoplasmata archaeon]
MRILVVDDDPLFREELTTYLSDEGHTTVTAPSVRKALEVLESESVDVLFTDLKMPRQSGLDLLSEVGRRWPGIFTVMVTGFATVDTAVEAMKSGAFDYIAKPFRTAQVLQVLHLIEDQRKFRDAHLPTGTALELARDLARRRRTRILYADIPPAPRGENLEFLAFDGTRPSDLPHTLDQFLRQHPSGGLVVARVDRMLENHRLEDIVAILQQLRERLDGGGPFAIGLDPSRVTQAQAEALRTAVTSPAVQSALEALSSPIRRRVLYRLAEGSGSFSDAMHAAELDDSPKLAFHLHRLVGEGLIAHLGDKYRLTPKGKDAVAILREMENVAAGKGTRTFVYQTPTSGPEAAPRPRGSGPQVKGG